MSVAVSKLAAERGYLYGMLSAVFRRPLDDKGLAALRSPEMLAALKSAGIDLGDDFASGNSAELLDLLAQEYTQLFHGPGNHIALYEGILCDGDAELQGKTCDAVRAFMGEIGFQVVPESGELGDHLSVELAFLAELCSREAAALETGDNDTAEFAACMQRQFHAAHLGRWADSFADKVKIRAELPFYVAMANLLEEFVSEDPRSRPKARSLHVNGNPVQNGVRHQMI